MVFTEARLSKGPSELLKLFDIVPGLEREKKQFDAFLQIDLAHLVMLVEQRILPAEIARQIFPVLLEIRSKGVEALSMDPDRGTLLLQVEGALASRIGEDIAGQLHTGRSRIDQGATARRIYKRAGLLKVMKEVNRLQRSLINLADQHAETIMPTYTHMQQAQPGTLGHYLLGIIERLQDDFERCVEVFARLNRSPLGAVGLSGTSWPLDRDRTAELLGFDTIVVNAKLGREAFYAAEIGAALSFIMATINDLACDLHLWSSIEFGMILIDDSYCTTSSIFPQKRNPIGLETVKFHAGQSVNWLGTALSTFRGEGTGDQNLRTVPFLDEAFIKAAGMLALFDGMVQTLQVNKDRTHELLSTSWSTASNLADVLVRHHSISFREAHHVVARLVKICEDEAILPLGVTPDHLVRAAQQTIHRDLHMSQNDLLLALDPDEFIRTRISAGSVSPAEVQKLLSADKASLAGNEAWVADSEDKLNAAESKLDRAVQRILG
ncbi:fumarate lyase [Naematelia encephala]|uniref:Arginosuccinase n=1 Tax=Naematelia encephala TaxID=71784 RepID=A0A1Y2B4R9_9TREE|nr:fumarate lyase [Naematelia encephala]